MVPTPFWGRKRSGHLNECEKSETISTTQRDGQARWPKVMVKYSELKSYILRMQYAPEPRQLENRVMPLHAGEHVGRGCTSRQERLSTAPAPRKLGKRNPGRAGYGTQPYSNTDHSGPAG